MRIPPTLVVVMFAVLGAAAILTAAEPPTGTPIQQTALLPASQEGKDYGVLEETPNQRRIRLGEEIKASYPPPEYGEALETPNHRRQRLGLPIVASYVGPDPGVAEETPNHRRARLAQTAGQ